MKKELLRMSAVMGICESRMKENFMYGLTRGTVVALNKCRLRLYSTALSV